MSFDPLIRMVREGQIADVYDPIAYGALVDKTVDSGPAFAAMFVAIESAGVGTVRLIGEYMTTRRAVRVGDPANELSAASVENITPGNTCGTVVARAEVLDQDGNFVGYIPIFDRITREPLNSQETEA